MFCCCKKPSSPQTRRLPNRNTEAEFDLCLTGIDGSGKSTFIRQMTLIHGPGYDERDADEFKEYVFNNIVVAMTILVEEMSRLNISLGDPDKEIDLEKFKNSTSDQKPSIEDQLRAARSLWRDRGIQECFKRRNEYAPRSRLEVSTEHFMNSLDRILEPGYIPITDDIIRVRRPTQGITDHSFEVRRCLFRIKDLGGEREYSAARRILLQETFTSIIFLAAMDEYDTYCYLTSMSGESQRENRLRVSIGQFRDLLKLPLSETTFILFLNKMDLLEEKLKTSSIADHFPEYQEMFGADELAKAQKFILKLFLPGRNRRTIYHHYTTATDSRAMEEVFNCVQSTILDIHLRDFCLA